MLLYDLKCGIVERRKWLLLPLVFFGIAIGHIVINNSSETTLGMYLFNQFIGCDPVNLQTREFEIPYIWLLLETGCVLFTFEYPMRDMGIFGKQIMIRFGSKIKWWLSKCVWCFLSVLIYWTVGFLITLLLCAAQNGEFSLALPDRFIMNTAEITDIRYFGEECHIFAILILTPFLASLALNYVQMLVALVANEMTALSVSLFIIIWSMCFKTPFAFLNYAMMYRCSDFFEDSLDFDKGVILIEAVIVAVILAGCAVIKNADILEPKKNGE